ncbi:ribokinase [Halobacillus sp. BBL2006]|uniref:ribokinase n=1 Tax=Halobacillus sp. BBL2006 TaxID=1543706 RepID=UPI0005431680|nr:ribokinase [Halobacillus sp. BBL2006]KHE71632.1 ribokinase [Halobacillus sp. BBL2006]
MTTKPKVTVIGSINMDLTVSTPVVPKQGETVLGDQFATYPGGKGANQAVAASRLGADVRLIGAVGKDAFGVELVQHLQEEGMDTSGVKTSETQPTGTATIILTDNDNRIIVAPGANYDVTPEYVEEQKDLIKGSDILLVQLEIPLVTIEFIANFAKEYDIPLVVNPAPYQSLPQAVLDYATFLTPNESEALRLSKEVEKSSQLQYKWVTTKGAHGVEATLRGKQVNIPGYEVPVKDTTGAGDTFNGALVTQLARQSSLKDAVTFANAAAALSITKLGAQSGMPTLKEVYAFLEEKSRT